MSVLPPRLRSPRASRAFLSGLLVCAAGSSLAVTGGIAPASAASRPSSYALSAHGYASKAQAGEVSLRSAPMAYSVLGCGRRTGVTRTNNVARAATGEADVDGARSVQRSYTTRKRETVVSSTSTAAAATFGSSTLGFKVTGLRSVAKAWVTKKGTLHASSKFTFSRITPVGPAPLPAPLTQPVDVILKQLAAHGPVTVPGVGILRLGGQTAGTSSTSARAGGVGLQVHLFGSDQLNNTSDDSDVILVRTYAKLSKAARYGLFGGSASGIEASAVDGVAAVGRNPLTPLDCEGTRGKVVTGSLAALDLAATNQVQVDGLRNRVYGRQGLPKRGLTGWTESTIADVDLAGGLHLEGIRVKAKAVRSRTGTITKSATQRIGAITVNGTPRRVPTPGQSLTIDGVATITVPKPVRTSNGIRVTGVRITLLSGTAAQSVITLGNASASVRAR